MAGVFSFPSTMAKRKPTTSNGVAPTNGAVPTYSNEYLLEANADLSERLAALEYALESLDWRHLSAQAEQEFSREGLRIITDLSRVFYLKNPLVQRGINLKKFYVWGQGLSVKASDPDIQAAIQSYNDDRRNRAELTSHQARTQKEVELETDGNIFLVLFPNARTGMVSTRSIPFNEIEEVVCNPEDAKEPWFYLRRWSQATTDINTGAVKVENKAAYYPDWHHTPTARPPAIGQIPVRWESPVFHIKIGGFSNWKFGVSEMYAAIDWAKAHKENLEDWASIVRAYRKFAFQLTTPGGNRGVAAAKAKLNTTLPGAETNPPPVAGSIFVANPDAKLEPIRTSGATVSAEDSRRLLLMVAAVAGLPETFYGDASVGSLATAKSLDRPTELMIRDRQTLWSDSLREIYDYVLLWQIKAPMGRLRSLGRVVVEDDDGEIVERIEWNDGINPHLDLDFPPITEHDIEQALDAIVKAATLDGKPLAGTLDLPTVARLVLVALGQDDVDEIVDQLFPGGEVPEDDDEAPERPQSEALMIEAVKELRGALAKLAEPGA